jgi:16S rRNA processing protein RimM
VEQIVPEVNIEDGYILLTPPAGLFEINEEGGEDPETRGSDYAEDEDEAEPEAKA